MVNFPVVGGMLVLWNLRDAPSVDRQPRMAPLAWRVVEVASGDRHIVAELAPGVLRLTTAIRNVDSPSRTVTTVSGRVYELGAGPADDPATIEMLMVWASLAFPDGCEDVSTELWLQLLGPEFQSLQN